MLRKTMLAGIAVLMFSCSNEKKEEKGNETESVIASVGNVGKLADAGNKLEEMTAALKKLTPLTNDQLKVVVPETLGGLKRKSFNAGGYSVSGISSVDAEYGADDSKYINVIVIDGAGEAGSSLVPLTTFALGMDSESESGNTKSKNTDVNGVRANVEETKTENSIRSSIRFLHKDRYSVTIEGTGYSVEDLEKFMKVLDLSSLK